MRKLSGFSRRALLLLFSLCLFTLFNLFLLRPAFAQALNSADTQLFLWLNEWHRPFMGTILYIAGRIWFGLLIFVGPAVLFIRAYGRPGIRITVFAAMLVVVTFLASDDLVKPLFKRLAPSHQPALLHRVLLTKEGTGETYSFVSARAATVFAMTLFVWLMTDREEKWVKSLLLVYALLVAYSRVYSGLHYPGDIAGSMAFGGVLALLAYRLYFFIEQNLGRASRAL
jgi:undecaprenyl-diphosphatase